MKAIALATLMTLSLPAFAVQGWDFPNGTTIQLETDTLAIEDGDVISFYDDASNDYHTADVVDIDRFGIATQLKVWDWETEDFRVLSIEE